MSKFIEVIDRNKGQVLLNVDSIAYVHRDIDGRCIVKFSNGEAIKPSATYEDTLNLLQISQ